MLPILTTLDDVSAICKYLATKPTGATPTDAKKVLPKVLDRRKLSAFKRWGLVDEVDGKLKLTELGRRAAKNGGAELAAVCQQIIREVPAYAAVVERAVHRDESVLSAAEVAAYLHENFGDDVGDADRTINDQAVCCFHVLQGAALGKLVIGRNSSPTRIEFKVEATKAFVEGSEAAEDLNGGDTHDDEANGFSIGLQPVAKPIANGHLPASNGHAPAAAPVVGLSPPVLPPRNNRVFITHGKNIKIVEHLKKLVTYGKLEPIVAKDHETAAKPVPDKVMDDMRNCSAAIIHVAAEDTVTDSKGNSHPKLNENVLIEIGAAMALYKRNFILLVEDGIKLPSNLQGLYECRYNGDMLDGEATMKLLDALNALH